MKIFAAGFLLTAVITACGSTSSSTTTSSSPRATASPTAATASSNAPSAAGVTCHFTALVEPEGSYTGHTVDGVVLTNAGSSACVLNGYPQLVLKDGAGQRVSSMSQIDGQGQAATATPSAVNVAAGGKANFVLEFTNVSSGSACPEVGGADVTLPSGGGQVSISFGAGFMPCPPSFNVGAVTA